MTYDELLEARRRRPFRPFVLKTTTGRSYDVRKPSDIAVSPIGLGVVDHDTETCDPVRIKEVESVTYADETSSRPT